jgi:hypothetical protein
LRDYLDGQKNRGGSPAATQQQYELQQQIDALATDRWIDVQ